MPSIPIQFVVALLLVIFLVRLLRREEGPPSRLFVVTMALYVLQTVFHGLRWGYGIQVAALPHPVMATIIPPMTWLAFSGLATSRTGGRPWLHLLPPLAIVLTYLLARPLVFLALPAISVGYGVALILLGRAGPDALDRVQLDGAISVQRAFTATGFMMIAEAGVDLAITVDFIRENGAHAAWIAGLASLIFIAVLGFASVIAGESAPVDDDMPVPAPAIAAPSGLPPAEAEAEDDQVMVAIDAAMRDRALYRDPELSLDRLARKAIIPSRRISAAVNRLRGMNVSQYVNGFRIDEACRRLAETDEPVTQIMLEVGFQTKSNFNREFLRVTGKSPSAWRAEHPSSDVYVRRSARTSG
jgi:AraC-like DNA-binding protein